jgi:hypothetical protein
MARGRWAGVDGITAFGWSGSALLGGYLIDRCGFAQVFLLTAFLQFLGIMFHMPLLFWVPLQELPTHSDVICNCSEPSAPQAPPHQQSSPVAGNVCTMCNACGPSEDASCPGCSSCVVDCYAGGSSPCGRVCKNFDVCKPSTGKCSSIGYTSSCCGENKGAIVHKAQCSCCTGCTCVHCLHEEDSRTSSCANIVGRESLDGFC